MHKQGNTFIYYPSSFSFIYIVNNATILCSINHVLIIFSCTCIINWSESTVLVYPASPSSLHTISHVLLADSRYYLHALTQYCYRLFNYICNTYILQLTKYHYSFTKAVRQMQPHDIIFTERILTVWVCMSLASDQPCIIIAIENKHQSMFSSFHGSTNSFHVQQHIPLGSS